MPTRPRIPRAIAAVINTMSHRPLRPHRRPTLPMLVTPRMALDDACQAAYKQPRRARELALRALQGAQSCGDHTTARAAFALAHTLECQED